MDIKRARSYLSSLSGPACFATYHIRTGRFVVGCMNLLGKAHLPTQDMITRVAKEGRSDLVL